jgi:ParB-like nuclease domain
MITAPQATGLVALADRIELWSIDGLRPYERNPRTHSAAQVDQIAASMVEFGWTNPVLVDEQGGILAGHGRLLAARKLGLTEVPVIRFEHLSEAQKRAYILSRQPDRPAGWLGRHTAGRGAGMAAGRALRPRPDRVRRLRAGAPAGAGRRRRRER